MSFSNAAETEVLEAIFRATALSWAGNTNLWLAGYTADPTDTGTAVTNEVAYTSYARALIVRSSGLSVSGNSVTNTGLVQLPQSTGAGSPITHLGLVTTSSGAGILIARITLSASIPTTVGIQPQFAASSLVFTLD